MKKMNATETKIGNVVIPKPIFLVQLLQSSTTEEVSVLVTCFHGWKSAPILVTVK